MKDDLEFSKTNDLSHMCCDFIGEDAMQSSLHSFYAAFMASLNQITKNGWQYTIHCFPMVEGYAVRVLVQMPNAHLPSHMMIIGDGSAIGEHDDSLRRAVMIAFIRANREYKLFSESTKDSDPILLSPGDWEDFQNRLNEPAKELPALRERLEEGSVFVDAEG